MHTFTSTVITYILQVADLTLILFYFNISDFSILVQASLRRLAIRDPDRCKNALKQLLKAGKTVPKWSLFYNTNVDKDDFMLAAKVDNMDCFDKREMYSLISNIYDSISESRSSKHNDGSSSSNEASTSDLTTDSKSSAKSGNSRDNGTIDSAQSLYFSVVKDFCYLNQRATMVHGSTVFIVEITRCRMTEAGRAQIMINSIKKVKMLKVGLRPGVSNHLMDGQIRRFE